jgi:Tfp pilus assembly protein PilF
MQRVLICVSAIFGCWQIIAGPFIPGDDNFVLANVPARSSVRNFDRELVQSRTNLTDPAIAVNLAQTYLNDQRATGDGRAAGQAEACLRHWWNNNEAPVPVLFLRAEIKQRNHEFTNALRDLDLVLSREPDRPEALVLRTTICQVLGRYDAARSSAFRLILVAPSLLAMTTVADLGGLSGKPESAYAMLKNSLRDARSTNSQECAWAMATLGQLALRAGENSDVENYFLRALELVPDDAYILAAYADYLFETDRPGAVKTLLAERTSHDHLLLRLAEAEALLGNEQMLLAKHKQRLSDGFNLGKLRGIQHGREEARYLLHILHLPARALQVAVENWRIQKEPADAQIVIEASVEARDFVPARDAVEWVGKYKWHSPAMDRLIQKFAAPRQVSSSMDSTNRKT